MINEEDGTFVACVQEFIIGLLEERVLVRRVLVCRTET